MTRETVSSAQLPSIALICASGEIRGYYECMEYEHRTASATRSVRRSRCLFITVGSSSRSCFLTTLTSAGVRSSPSVLIHPLEAEFGWSRTLIASAVSMNLLLFRRCCADQRLADRPLSGRAK